MRVTMGSLLLLLAAVFLVLELIALADPAGTSLANDADPFGPPPPWYTHLAWFAVAGSLGFAGVRMIRRRGAR